MQGESLVFLFKGDILVWGWEVVYYYYYEYLAVYMVKWYYGIVIEDYKFVYFYYDIDIWEFYDCKCDLLEMNNLINDFVYLEICVQLEKELQALWVKYKDLEELDQYYIDLYKQVEK